MKPTIFIAIIFCLLSCGQKKQITQTNIDVLHCENGVKEPISDSPPYTVVKIVNLETNEDCLITAISQLEIKDSMIFVLDIMSKLFVFNIDGRFIAQIGRIGEGPGEYRVLNAFYLDDTSVVIIDGYKSALIKYDFKGKYLSSEKIPMEFIRQSMQAVKMENTLFLAHGISGIQENDNMAVSVIDLKTNQLKSKQFSYAPIKLNNYIHHYSKHLMSKSEEGVSLITLLCDTIYNYNGQLFTPKYVVETPSKMASKSQITENTESLTSDIVRLGKDGFFTGFWGIFETSEHIILEWWDKGIIAGYFLCNKRTKQGNYYLYSYSAEAENVPLFRIKYAHNDIFVGDSQADQLLRSEWNIPGEAGQKFKNICSLLKEDDNPVLFFYKFKKN